MTVDLTKEFGEGFDGLVVKGFQTWTAIDGTWIGVEFVLADDTPVRLVVPHDGLDRLWREMKRCSEECSDRQETVRH